jgi:serine/threonine protein phosphatase PrpC
VWVLCSDGLSGHVHPDEILKIAGSHCPSEASRQFIELANSRGGRDNITTVIVKIKEVIKSGEPSEEEKTKKRWNPFSKD